MLRKIHGKFWVIAEDQCHPAWIEESGRLDHDGYARANLVPLLSPGDTVIDVGAHWGTHTQMYLDAVGPTGTVVAYEPHPESFECLKRNCPDAEVHHMALGARIAHETLAINAANAGASHLGAGNLFDPQVLVTTLDDHARGWMRPGMRLRLIKIDAEGAEPEVIRGGKDLIAAFRPLLYLESNPGALLRRGHSVQGLRQLLDDLDYGCEFLPPSGNWTWPQVDVLCRPR